VQYKKTTRHMFQTKVVEKIKRHFVFNNFFFILPVYEIIWEHTVERNSQQMTIWRKRIACWRPKATNTDPGCVILIAFPLQFWLQEHASSFVIRTLPALFKFRFVGGLQPGSPPPPFDAPMVPTPVDECSIRASL
jgi:hypothetical protein